jgi:hypothetical protein
MICPFCKENGFDAAGLKAHLIHVCDVYGKTETVVMNFQARQQQKAGAPASTNKLKAEIALLEKVRCTLKRRMYDYELVDCNKALIAVIAQLSA